MREKKREKGERAGVHLFNCESLHRNKVTEKKRDVKPGRKRKERNERKKESRTPLSKA
jgi:hypothetical protein